MRTGVFFDIPERPRDMAALWQHGRPLSPDSLPNWLDPHSAATYREVLSHRPLSQSERQSVAYLRELEALEDIGLVVEAQPNELSLRKVYVAAPRPQDVWSIGLYSGSSPVSLRPHPAIQNPVLTRDDVTDVPATFAADPFLLFADECWHMFFEVMNWRTGKGEIGLATSTDGRDWDYRQIVLSEPFHLSYPYVFESHGVRYMIPESFQAGAVRLYQATDFPTRWEFRATLIEAPYLADPSIIRYAGRWWMWVEASPTQAHDTLRLFHSAELLSGWQEHPLSPIIASDARHARPAGRIVEWDGRLIRFAQNCEPAYGSDVRAFEITSLTPTTYTEQPLGRVPLLGPGDSEWNQRGMHHVDPQRLDANHWIACVDGWRLEGAT